MRNKPKPIKIYDKLINQLVTKSFPILKNKKIKVYESNELKHSAEAFKFLSFLRIKTNPRLRDYNKTHLIGIFSHELSHLEKWEKEKFDYYFIRGFRLIFKKYIKKDEKETDINAIMKGYSRELYSQRKSIWNSKKAKELRWKYLSPNEIKKISQELRKW